MSRLGEVVTLRGEITKCLPDHAYMAKVPTPLRIHPETIEYEHIGGLSPFREFCLRRGLAHGPPVDSFKTEEVVDVQIEFSGHNTVDLYALPRFRSPDRKLLVRASLDAIASRSDEELLSFLVEYFIGRSRRPEFFSARDRTESPEPPAAMKCGQHQEQKEEA